MDFNLDFVHFLAPKGSKYLPTEALNQAGRGF